MAVLSNSKGKRGGRECARILSELLGCERYAIDYTLTMSLPVFAELVRRQATPF
jgi:hypothetical protein